MKKIISFCHRTDRQGKGGVHKKYLLYFLKGGVHNFLLCLTCSFPIKLRVKYFLNHPQFDNENESDLKNSKKRLRTPQNTYRQLFIF